MKLRIYSLLTNIEIEKNLFSNDIFFLIKLSTNTIFVVQADLSLFIQRKVRTPKSNAAGNTRHLFIDRNSATESMYR